MYLHCLHNTLSLANPSLENLEIKSARLPLSLLFSEERICHKSTALHDYALLSMLTTSRKSATTQCHCSHIAEKSTICAIQRERQKRGVAKRKSLVYYIFCMFSTKWAKIILNKPILFV